LLAVLAVLAVYGHIAQLQGRFCEGFEPSQLAGMKVATNWEPSLSAQLDRVRMRHRELPIEQNRCFCVWRFFLPAAQPQLSFHLPLNRPNP
jgi:hypothetical protein